MDDKRLTVDLLCGHHELDHFDCGHRESNTLARGLLAQVREGRDWRYGNKFMAVAVVNGRAVVGIAAACGVYLEADRDADGLPVQGKCLFYYLLATDRSPNANRVAALKRLRDEMADIQEQFLPTEEYIGEIAVPDRAGNPVQEKRLVTWLEGQHFRPLGTKPYIWFRPRGTPPSP